MEDETEIRRDFRRKLLEADFTASQDLDKAIMALASGGIGLSVALAKDVDGKALHDSLVWLHSAWVLFAVSLILVLFSYLASQLAVRRALQEQLSGSSSDAKTLNGDGWRWATTALNLCAVTALIFGVVCMVVFGVSATRRMASLDDARSANTHQRHSCTEASGKTDRGWSPPKLPTPTPSPAPAAPSVPPKPPAVPSKK